MPYKSKAQSRYMHAAHPQIAKKWDKEQEGPIRIERVKKKATKKKRGR
jgi:hypothetical protein